MFLQVSQCRLAHVSYSRIRSLNYSNCTSLGLLLVSFSETDGIRSHLSFNLSGNISIIIIV